MKRRIRWLMVAFAASWAAPPAMAQDEGAAPIRPRPAEIQPLAPQSLLLDVINTGRRLVAVGDRGHILVSADGNLWAQVEAPVRSALTAVQFAKGGEAGWAVGHDAVILRTVDGGATWSLQNFEPELQRPFLDLLVLDADSAIVVGSYGMMRRTDDGGATWTQVDAPEVLEDEFHLNSITRLDDGSLFVAGEMGLLAISPDKGKTWIRLESPYESSFFGAVGTGGPGVMIHGLRGTLYTNRDPLNQRGADAWQPIENDNVATMFGSARLDDGRTVMVGLNGVVTLVEGRQIQHFRSARGTPLSAVIGFGDGLLAVGESGVQRAPLTLSER
tara:strand:- start:38287 stop:39276 length:990 start_codon:yes stop_codon:yes gene_type:complete